MDKVNKVHFYLTMTCDEIEQLRRIGGGSITAGLCNFTLDKLYTHRTSVRMLPDDLQTFKDIGGGNVTKGIRRALHVNMSRENLIQ
jgi:hypothetical protein